MTLGETTNGDIELSTCMHGKLQDTPLIESLSREMSELEQRTLKQAL